MPFKAEETYVIHNIVDPRPVQRTGLECPLALVNKPNSYSKVSSYTNLCSWQCLYGFLDMSVRSFHVLGTRTQSDTKLYEQLRFFTSDLMSFIYEENMKNIMNCIVPVQALVGTIQFWSKHPPAVHQPVYQVIVV